MKEKLIYNHASTTEKAEVNLFAVKYLIKHCIETKKSPEELLKVQPVQETSEDFISFIDKRYITKAYEDAIGHLPRVIEALIEFQGFDSAKLAARFFTLQNATENEDALEKNALSLKEATRAMPNFNWLEGIPGIAEIKQLWHFGISLSWALFQWGEPAWRKPAVPASLNTPIDFNSFLSTTVDKQGLSNFERIWWIGNACLVGVVHFATLRMLCTLPKITVFPEMPNFKDIYSRITDLITNIDVPSSFSPTLAQSINKLKKAKQKICLLFFANPPMVHRWNTKNIMPRLAIRRYCYLVDRILDMYGEVKGLEYWLLTVEQTAKMYGFKNLLELVEYGKWRKDGMELYQKSVLREPASSNSGNS